VLRVPFSRLDFFQTLSMFIHAAGARFLGLFRAGEGIEEEEWCPPRSNRCRFKLVLHKLRETFIHPCFDLYRV